MGSDAFVWEHARGGEAKRGVLIEVKSLATVRLEWVEIGPTDGAAYEEANGLVCVRDHRRCHFQLIEYE